MALTTPSAYLSINCAYSNRAGILAYGTPLNEWIAVPSLVLWDVPLNVASRILWLTCGKAIVIGTIV